MQIQHTYSNTVKYKYTSTIGRLKYTGDSVVQVQTHLLTSDFGSSTRGERQFLKVFRNHTMLTTSFNGRNTTLYPNGRSSTIVFHSPTSKSQLPGRIPTSQHHWRTQLLLSAIEADNPTVCLHRPKSTFNWRIFQNLQILSTIAWRYSHSSPISYLGFIMTMVTVISFAHERKLYRMLCT